MVNEMQNNLPKRMKIDYFDDYMHIQKKWVGQSTLIIGLLFLVWVGVFLRTFKLVAEGIRDGDLPLILLALLFAVGAALLAYFLVANWLNKTDIFVNKYLIEIRISPMPWRGNMQLDTADIKEFFVERHVAGSEKKRKVTFAVLFRQNNDKTTNLVSGLESQDQALFIEKRIENYLGMSDNA